MIKAFLFTLILGLVAWSVADAQVCSGLSGVLRPKGYEALTVSSSVVRLTIPQGSELAMATVETDSIRFRDDGTDPTDTVGVPVAAGSGLVICPGSISRIEFVMSGSNDATLHVLYYGR